MPGPRRRTGYIDYVLKVGGAQVQGLAAITAHNGWAMAATGACIVITGLVILSFIISQLHRILQIFDKKETAQPDIVEESAPAAPSKDTAGADPLADIAATAKQYRLLTSQLGNTFQLAQLYQALDTAQVPHPHITVRELKATGYLAAAEEGQFSWKNV